MLVWPPCSPRHCRPAYAGLKNNVDTQQMELQMHKWRPGIEDFVPHWELAQYIQTAAASNGLSDAIRFQTRVDLLEKHGERWAVQTTTLFQDERYGTIESSDTAVRLLCVLLHRFLC